MPGRNVKRSPKPIATGFFNENSMSENTLQKDQIEVAKVLIDLADNDLTRRMGVRFAEIRAKTIFYQSFSVAMIAAHVAAWQLLGVDRIIEVISSAISAGLFCAVLFLSVLNLSGANYRGGALERYKNWLMSFDEDKKGQLGIYSDILQKYDLALEDLKTVDLIRSARLRKMNLMTLLALISSGLSLATLL